ncbi:hypothetical protein GRI58_13770 [Porphyrobacter algicida]|uniref:HIG1 domain-containing protein n=1 Tax=Qipengyuania algicida TaxID=1836209 RepID=A0A845ASM2_9SPHN|nr:HIG1 domain-containing protein [Qipengyuania algicida]MXP29878.1 hypothetical protein [Qipengyuania algicida]
MTTFLVIILIGLMLATLISLIRGVVAFIRSTKVDLESGGGDRATEMQLLQNRMMMNRIKFQALAIVVVVILLAVAH